MLGAGVGTTGEGVNVSVPLGGCALTVGGSDDGVGPGVDVKVGVCVDVGTGVDVSVPSAGSALGEDVDGDRLALTFGAGFGVCVAVGANV
jgi:hypothetical protein